MTRSKGEAYRRLKKGMEDMDKVEGYGKGTDNEEKVNIYKGNGEDTYIGKR